MSDESKSGAVGGPTDAMQRASKIEDLADVIRNGIYGDDLQSGTDVRLALDALNELAALSGEHGGRDSAPRVHGVTWVVIRSGHVILERCEKKARVLGVGEWFIPGGKIEGDETPEEALRRELREEWPTVELLSAVPLPIVEGSPVPPGPRGLFLMRPFAIEMRGMIPSASSEGTPIRAFTISEALESPVPQVRMMVVAAMSAPSHPHGEPPK